MHCAGGLTENDFILAAKINALDMQTLMRRKATDWTPGKAYRWNGRNCHRYGHEKKNCFSLLLVCFGVKWCPEDVPGSRRILGFLQVWKKIKNMKWLFSLCLALFLFSEYEAYRSVELHMPAFDNPNFYFLFC